MTLHLIRGGTAPRGSRTVTTRALRHQAVPNGDEGCAPFGRGLSDDPEARRRELMVVLELCAARARGARELGTLPMRDTGDS